MRGQPRGGLVADLDGLGDLHLERRVEKRNAADLLQIRVDRVLGADPSAIRLRSASRSPRARSVGPQRAVGLGHSPRRLRRRHLRTRSSTSSSTRATPSALTRSIKVVSTSGVSSTLCSTSINSSGVSAPWRRPAASAASKSICDTPAGSASCAMDANDSRRRVGQFTPPSSTAIAESSLTCAIPTLSLLRLPLHEPRYQLVGGSAPGPGSSSSASQRRTCAVSAARACQDSRSPATRSPFRSGRAAPPRARARPRPSRPGRRSQRLLSAAPPQ